MFIIPDNFFYLYLRKNKNNEKDILPSDIVRRRLRPTGHLPGNRIRAEGGVHGLLFDIQQESELHRPGRRRLHLARHLLGLNKYDSYNFRQYFCYDDEVGLQDNQINSLHLDSRGRLWVATVNGIAINSGGDGFRRIPDSFTDNRSMSGILETESGDIYFTDNYSLNRYDPAKDSILRVLPARDSSMVRTLLHRPRRRSMGRPGQRDRPLPRRRRREVQRQPPAMASRVFDTPNGNIWITDGRKLVIVNTRTRAFVDVPGPVATESEIRSGYISWIFPIGDYHLLFIMQNGRFYLYNSRENRLMSGDDPDFPFELPPFTNISAIFRDSDHNIWFGSETRASSWRGATATSSTPKTTGFPSSRTRRWPR